MREERFGPFAAAPQIRGEHPKTFERRLHVVSCLLISRVVFPIDALAGDQELHGFS